MTILTSFKTAGDINTSPPVWFFVTDARELREVLFTGNTDLVSYIINSILIAAGGTLLAMVLTFPAAYAIVRYEVGRNLGPSAGHQSSAPCR